MNAEAKVAPAGAVAVDPPSGLLGRADAEPRTVHLILWTMCLAHFLNDLLQSLLSSIFPILKASYNLD
ncbi:MAG TPA: hypothetical protein VIL72_12035, partial [Beijerinckiaceae bacterium]